MHERAQRSERSQVCRRMAEISEYPPAADAGVVDARVMLENMNQEVVGLGQCNVRIACMCQLQELEYMRYYLGAHMITKTSFLFLFDHFYMCLQCHFYVVCTRLMSCCLNQ